MKAITSTEIHPVLERELERFCAVLESASKDDLQVTPGISAQYWCGQQMVEHLILALNRSQSELSQHIENRRKKMAKPTILQRVIRSHFFWFRSMPRGVLAPYGLRPTEWTAESGKELSARLIAAVVKLDKTLVQSRRIFGMEACAEHWMYGPLRVEDWRAYNAIHLRHHLKQLKDALEYVKNPPSMETAVDVLQSGWVSADPEKREWRRE